MNEIVFFSSNYLKKEYTLGVYHVKNSSGKQLTQTQSPDFSFHFASKTITKMRISFESNTL